MDSTASNGKALIVREPEMKTNVDTGASNYDQQKIRNQMVAAESKNCRLGWLLAEKGVSAFLG